QTLQRTAQVPKIDFTHGLYLLLLHFLQLRPNLWMGADRLSNDSCFLAVPAGGEGCPTQSLRHVRGQVYGLASFHGVSSSRFWAHFSPRFATGCAGAHPAPREGGGCAGHGEEGHSSTVSSRPR